MTVARSLISNDCSLVSGSVTVRCNWPEKSAPDEVAIVPYVTSGGDSIAISSLAGLAGASLGLFLADEGFSVMLFLFSSLFLWWNRSMAALGRRWLRNDSLKGSGVCSWEVAEDLGDACDLPKPKPKMRPGISGRGGGVADL